MKSTGEVMAIDADPEIAYFKSQVAAGSPLPLPGHGGVILCVRDEDKARVRVENSGEGIPADELPHVFERFYKSDRSRGLDKTGTGLGLYIAKTNIEKMGGGISVDSVPGENTRFEFYLPLANEK